MPPVQGPEVPVTGRNIPPRRSRPGPPQDPLDHLPVIVPPTSPTRRPVRQQRLQSRPLCISQIVTIEHKTGLPGRPVKIGETRPSMTTLPPCADALILRSVACPAFRAACRPVGHAMDLAL